MSKATRSSTTAAPITTPALPSTSRRRLLAGSVASSIAAAIGLSADAAATLTPITSPDHLDAELLATCAAFDQLQHAFGAVSGSHPAGSAEEAACDAERVRIGDEQAPLIARMAALRAATHDGQVARARSFALWNYELMKPDPADIIEVFTAAIVRDLVGMGAA